MRRYSHAILAIIILLTIVGAFFVYPKFFGAQFRPWRLGLDLVGGTHLTYLVDLSLISESDEESVLNGIRDVIERRVNLFGVSEPQVFIAKSGEDTHLIAELAGIRDVSEAIKVIGETPFLEFREVEIKEAGAGSGGEADNPQVRFVATELTGRYVTGAQLVRDPVTQEFQVAVSFNEEGGRIFEALTKKNIGERLAIFLDGAPISAPVVQEVIAGGNAVITGKFKIEEAKQLVERFNAGALPAPITLINQRTVSAQLGIDSLNKTIFAGAVGTLLVALFMVFYYGMFGVFAALALFIYVILTLSVFKAIPVTMTLAGLAGFILTIGMAVDANILIFERTNEELKKGLSKIAAIEEGFRRAWFSIRDSNISTIITALILYYFTSSFIRGFALTLLIGTLISMFSAITVTRTFLRVFVKTRSLNPSAKGGSAVRLSSPSKSSGGKS